MCLHFLSPQVEELEMENARMRKEIETGKEEKRRQVISDNYVCMSIHFTSICVTTHLLYSQEH